MADIISRRVITLPEVKGILARIDQDKMDQIQRWTYNYVTKFSKVTEEKARAMKDRLMNECGLTEEEAVEIINVMPSSIEELRTFTFGWKKLILTETLEKMLKILDEGRGIE
ncbi:MAG: hypothetical protein RMJ59_02945 [Candidatus Nitrosocaldus sp.]|nr:hypothetical protein [Candidatus Nitrosocaldus sp.]MCS7141467.1 hypothetical protein [Candidatus Nitrosocaldus sp.]MDW7999673.1 hypothetical protein [Candidatus Nitrosocaldus sp.]MDW8275327.1 hypothetical protein [Candidatus Nitrosocaldus sp.]